ncbi:hypothetical protein ACDQ55_05820 [Chitinophaga sp. 30R24]|uniref:hypothetical protein n=1 Tax=Chitinophaga sp. 30R24 TaxID=3248838 RepID=UPI003B90AECF
MKYNTEINDSSAIQNLRQINQQIAAANGAPQAILQSLKAQMLLDYYQQNRRLLYQRTAIANNTGTDITTWSADRLHQEIAAAYLAYVSHKQLLQQTGLEQFDAIISKGNTRALRPTLYDLLAHRALDYFKSGQATETQPANQFELTDPEAFAPATVFASHHSAGINVKVVE